MSVHAHHKSIDGILRVVAPVGRVALASVKKRPVLYTAILGLVGVGIFLGVNGFPRPVYAATIVVNTTTTIVAPDGNCEFGEALSNANSGGDNTGGDCVAGTASGLDIITFNIAGAGPHVITGNFDITDSLTIDATTQTDASCPMVSRNLPIVFDGFIQMHAPATIKGITQYGSDFTGIILSAGSDGTVITCSNIGTNATGSAVGASANTLGGIAGEGTGITIANITIGGTGANDKNIIAGNPEDGILTFVLMSDITIIGNYIGIGADGVTAIPNSHEGVNILGSTGVSIGDGTAGGRNIISGNGATGLIVSSDASDVSIIGNYVGIGADGATAVPNGEDGVRLSGDTLVLGNGTAGGRNIISGNDENGVFVSDATNVSIKGNYIGTDSTGLIAVPNGDGTSFFSGLSLVGASIQSENITIGGTGTNEGNVISGNDGVGIAAYATAAVTVLGNIIGLGADGMTVLGNEFPGINLSNDSLTSLFALDDWQIGDGTAGGRNIISGNGAGATVDFDNNAAFQGSNIVVKGNYFDVKADGVTAVSSGGVNTTNYSVLIGNEGSSNVYAPSNVIFGGPNAGDGNVVGYIGIVGGPVTIQGNFFGVAADGTTPTSGQGAIAMASLSGDSNILIGGSTTAHGNIILNDNSTAFALSDDMPAPISAFCGLLFGVVDLPCFTDVTIQNNTITGGGLGGIALINFGGGVTLPTALSDWTITNNTITGSVGPGINIIGNATGITIGGTGAGNTIHGNTRSGIELGGLSGAFPSLVSFLENEIYNNTLLGIDLGGADGNGNYLIDTTGAVNANDALDGDSGSNAILNHPTIYHTDQSGVNAIVKYILDVPVTGFPYRVDFFTNPSGLDNSYFGEGEVFVASANVTPGAGQESFSKILSNTDIEDVITATVTACTNAGCTTFGATSEFSNSSPKGVDFGDAPGDHTLINPSAAYHVITTAYLGSCVDGDDGTSQNNAATDDDVAAAIQASATVGTCASAGDDEDGVTFSGDTTAQSTVITPTAIVSANGFISAWFDSNGDGDFSDTGEDIISNTAVTTGSNVLATFTTPATDDTYPIRFRYTTTSQSSPSATGEMIGGEVEDYAIIVGTPPSEDDEDPTESCCAPHDEPIDYCPALPGIQSSTTLCPPPPFNYEEDPVDPDPVDPDEILDPNESTDDNSDNQDQTTDSQTQDNSTNEQLAISDEENPQSSTGSFLVAIIQSPVVQKTTQTALPLIGSILYLAFDYSRRLLGIPWYRRKRYWGVVYDSQTGEPIDPAYVTLKDAQGNEVATAISDLQGRYGFVADPGVYTITAGKTNYVFPSQHPETFLGTYPDPYLGAPLNLEKDMLVMQNIPMDPIGRDWNQSEKETMFSRMKSSKIVQNIGSALFFASGIFTLYSLITNPTVWNIIVTVWFVGLVFYTRIQSKPIQAFGSIAQGSEPLAHAKITLNNPRTHTTVLSRTTNRDGHYFFLAENGEYDATIVHDQGSNEIPYEVTKGVGDVTIKI